MAYYRATVEITTPYGGRPGNDLVEVTIKLPASAVYGDDDKCAERDALSEVAKLDLPALLGDRIFTDVSVSVSYDHV
jgi:hypothetical protein